MGRKSAAGKNCECLYQELVADKTYEAFFFAIDMLMALFARVQDDTTLDVYRSPDTDFGKALLGRAYSASVFCLQVLRDIDMRNDPDILSGGQQSWKLTVGTLAIRILVGLETKKVHGFKGIQNLFNHRVGDKLEYIDRLIEHFKELDRNS
jgi:hypothetical protein